ncbi:MAG: 4Fe-4S binding protein [Zymomonas mobilis]|uniref:4Fe-4S binding protein n=1 Tax=Zymomonas mobilis TaxID=542 RepID=A0A542W3K9_ZYMMB|nr:4Fe-4S binding protein [Zymomonas mobilis]TQL18099.1 4Fe-4S binding protein [Zymomonas mobilis]
MSYKIVVENCTACGACEFECPNSAISMKGDEFIINADKCTECEGQFDSPQCADVCPMPDTCIPA